MSPQAQHYPRIDGLRTLAVGAVFFQHWCYPWLYLLPKNCNPGQLGVDLFFVISGFLITGILLRARSRLHSSGSTKTRVLKAFYARRFLRIFPLYYGVVVIATLFGMTAVSNHLWWHLSYTTNIHNCLHGTPNPATHFWSLAVEEQFYLCWPFLILFVPTRFVFRVVVFCIVLQPVVAVSLLACGHSNLLDSSPLGSLHALGGGALLAIVTIRRQDQISHRQLQKGFACLIPFIVFYWSPYFPDSKVLKIFSDLVVIAFFVMVIAWATKEKQGLGGWLLEHSSVQFLGRISYGLYILHPFVPIAFRGILGQLGTSPAQQFGILQLPIFFCTTVAFASASWFFFERPINAHKSNFPYLKVQGRT